MGEFKLFMGSIPVDKKWSGNESFWKKAQVKDVT